MTNGEVFKNYIITRRAFVLGMCNSSLLSLFGLKLLHMQIFESSEYKALSQQNMVQAIMLHPKRGLILDRHDRAIASNKTIFNVVFDKKKSKKYIDSSIKIGNLLELKEDEINEITKKIKNSNSKYPVIILNNISWENLIMIEEQIENLEGVCIEVSEFRLYPYKECMSHVIGYIGILNENEKKNLKIPSAGSFRLGKLGIEKYYDQHLRGIFGIKKIEVNALGKETRQIYTQNSINGLNLKINIDAELQKYIYSIIPETGGSVIVSDLNTGHVLSAVSKTGFDPEKFIHGISKTYWNNLLNNRTNPIINRVCQSIYPPGSIFKIITVLAALESGIDPNIKVECMGQLSVLGKSHFRCWHKKGHGFLDMQNAIEKSCNAYMYHIAKLVGIRKIVAVAKMCGFGELTGIDIPSESKGKIFNLNKYHKNNISEVLNISIGQGQIAVTPIQLAQFISIIASGGIGHKLRIFGDGEVIKTNIDPKNIEFIKQSMYYSINNPGGTGYKARLTCTSKYYLSGKTGTSQVISKNGEIDLSAETVDFASRNHGLFVGFISSTKPHYSITTVIDHGKSGQIAALLSKDVMMKLIDLGYLV